MSTNRYNLSTILDSYKNYLAAGKLKPVSIKNYASDIRFFLLWLQQLTIDTSSMSQNFDIKDTFSIDPITIVKSFKDYLINEELPISTINRRIASLRVFLKFLCSKTIISITQLEQLFLILSPYKKDKYVSFEEMIHMFSNDMKNEIVDKNNSLNDLKVIKDIFL
jgi:site-specific recombinase XerD